MDEPASALDPIATAGIEDLIDHLRQRYTIVIITHSMQQARASLNASPFSISDASSRMAMPLISSSTLACA